MRRAEESRRLRWSRGVAAALLGSLLLPLGCAMVSGPAGPGGDAEIRPDAPADYDFLVARQHELGGRLAESFAAYSRAAAKDPGSAYLHRKLAEIGARRGDYAQALAHAERAHALDPDDADVSLFLASLYRIRKDAEGAERVLRDDSGEPLSRDAALLLLNIYLEHDRFDEARALARSLIEEDPQDLRGYLAMASVYDRLERYEDYERVLRDALERQPGNLAVLNLMARSRRERGDREGEIEVYREILEEIPGHQSTLLDLAEAQVALGRSDEAIATLEEAHASHPDPRLALRLAVLEYQAGRYRSAAERFQGVLDEWPEEYEVAYFLGLCRQRLGELEAAKRAWRSVPQDHERYADARVQIAGIHEQQEDYRRALAEVEKAREADPERSLDVYAASLRAKAGDFEGAVASLEKLLAESPEDDELLYTLGVVYGEAGRFDESLDYMMRALEVNPDNASALNYVGYTWAERGKNLDEAERMITRALELRPDDGFITDSLGWVYYMRAQPLLGSGRVGAGRELLRRAVQQLERASRLTGGDPVISEHLGDAYRLLDRRQKALEAYEEALRLDPREDEQPDLRRKHRELLQELEGE